MKFAIRMGGVFAQAVVERMTNGGAADRGLPPIYDWWMLTDIYTHPWIRGKGYASLVIKQATDWADEEGCSLYLYITPFEKGCEVRSKKERARRVELLRQLYLRHGFIDHNEGMVRSWELKKSQCGETPADSSTKLIKQHRMQNQPSSSGKSSCD